MPRVRHHGVRPEHQSPGRFRQTSGQPARPQRIGRYGHIVDKHGIGHDPLAGLQSGRQPAGDADADDAARPGGEPVKHRFQPRMIAATGDGLDVRAGDNAPFPLQAGGGKDHHMPWATRRTLPRRRLR